MTTGTIWLSKNTPFVPVALTTTTASNTTLTTSGDYTASGINVGDVISGTGIIDGTYVASIESTTSLTMSQAATDATANSRTFTRPGRAALNPLVAKVVNSVTASSASCGYRVRFSPSPNHVDVTCASNDAGWFSVLCA